MASYWRPLFPIIASTLLASSAFAREHRKRVIGIVVEVSNSTVKLSHRKLFGGESITAVRVTPDTKIIQFFGRDRSAQVDISDLRNGDVALVKTLQVEGKLVAEALLFKRLEPAELVWPEGPFP